MFDTAFEIIISHEGGYVDDPKDPGGETKYGISKRAYPDIDIANLTLDDAKAIYKRDYWDACRCDDIIFDGLALIVFDTAVNQGEGTAKRMLQHAAGARADGIIGPNTLAKVNDGEFDQLIRNYTTKRILRYIATKNFDRYGKGWINRAVETLIRAMEA